MAWLPDSWPRAWALALLAGALAAPAGAQPQAEFGEELVVTEVLLDVRVTDRAGRLILGLAAEDFVVEEDGRPVELTGAEFYRQRPDLEGSADDASQPALSDRHFILLFYHDRRPTPDALRQRARAREGVRRWVVDELRGNDHVAVLRHDRGLVVIQDFTPDRLATVEALARATTRKDDGAPGGGDGPPRQGPPRLGVSLARDLPQGADLARRSRRLYDALELVAGAAGALRGRKNLLFFNLAAGDLDTFGRYRHQGRFLPPLIEALNGSNVAVYSLDLFQGPGSAALSAALSSLAFDTGGRYYGHSPHLADRLREISDENSGYYLLSYKSRHPRDAQGFQPVAVRTRDPALRAVARPGYVYGPGPPEDG